MLYNLLKPIIWQINPEIAHDIVIKLLKNNIVNLFLKSKPDKILKCKLGSIELPSPIGLAAGFDKNFEVFDKMFNLGFGFVEAGTVTPLPQPGNEKPRIFRLLEDEALINRLGFNNKGLSVIKDNILSKYSRFIPNKLGANIGPNKDSSNRIADYITCYKSLVKFTDYITINISSPNTPGLRSFENKEIDDLLNELSRNRQNDKSIFIKISPDLEKNDLEQSIYKILNYGMDGIVLTNTSISRPQHLQSKFSSEKGGLSGKPLKDKSRESISIAFRITQNHIPIIGVGGIFDHNDVINYLKAGASAVQIYTGLIYKGPSVAANINNELVNYLKTNGLKSITELIGINH